MFVSVCSSTSSSNKYGPTVAYRIPHDSIIWFMRRTHPVLDFVEPFILHFVYVHSHKKKTTEYVIQKKIWIMCALTDPVTVLNFPQMVLVDATTILLNSPRMILVDTAI